MASSTDPQIAALEAVCDKRYARIYTAAGLLDMSPAEAEARAAHSVACYLRIWIAKHASETGAHPDHQRRTDRRREFATALLEGYSG